MTFYHVFPELVSLIYTGIPRSAVYKLTLRCRHRHSTMVIMILCVKLAGLRHAPIGSRILFGYIYRCGSFKEILSCNLVNSVRKYSP